MADLSVPDAARVLGVNRARVRALLSAGEIRGRKIGARWLVDEESARARADAPRADGRPFSPQHAWAYLLLLSGEDVPWIDAASRSRLRRRIAIAPVRETLPRLRRRGVPHYYRASAAAAKEVVSAHGFIPSGVSAASALELPLVVRDHADGYVSERVLADLTYRLALLPATPASSNIVLRVSSHLAGLRARKVAPVGAVSVDLLESMDQRVRRAGDQLAENLRADRHQTR